MTYVESDLEMNLTERSSLTKVSAKFSSRESVMKVLSTGDT